MIGSGLILTVLCPLVVAKMVSPVMKMLKFNNNPEIKEALEDIVDNDDRENDTKNLDIDD